MKRPFQIRTAFALMCWIAAMAAAFALDRPVAQLMRRTGIDQFIHDRRWFEDLLKSPGEFWFVLIVVAALYMRHPLKFRAAALVFGGALISGTNGAMKWIVGRTRPYKLFDEQGSALLAPFHLEPFRGGIPGAIQQANLCFPSGHTAWAFATAAAMSILLPRWRVVFYAVAAVVGIERVAENAHWLSDVVCAAALGVVSVRLLHRVWWNAWAYREETESHHGRQPLPVTGDSCL